MLNRDQWSTDPNRQPHSIYYLPAQQLLDSITEQLSDALVHIQDPVVVDGRREHQHHKGSLVHVCAHLRDFLFVFCLPFEGFLALALAVETDLFSVSFDFLFLGHVGKVCAWSAATVRGGSLFALVYMEMYMCVSKMTMCMYICACRFFTHRRRHLHGRLNWR